MSLTIIVPTRNEADNIPRLAGELDRVARSLDRETLVVFVDDSTDDYTVQALCTARDAHPELGIDVVHRPAGERHNGLAGAVTAGIERARSTGSELALVMDADLQHPPALIPLLVGATTSADVVIASRYHPDGSAGGLNGPVRHAVSRASTLLAKLLHPVALRGVSDPMTGFFVLRTECINTSGLQAAGFKILLEILATHPGLRRSEVPLQFGERLAGVSNASLNTGKLFLTQLWRLKKRYLGRVMRLGTLQ